MPIRNEFGGVYKTVQVADGTGTLIDIIVNNLQKSRSMTAEQKNYVQGTAENRILSVGNIEETFQISAPILIGGGSAIDGRLLLFNQVTNVLKRKGAVLPLLKNATVSVNDGSTDISFTLQSDGNSLYSAAFNIKDDKNPPTQLDPLTNIPTREAKWYDFRARFGPYRFFIKDVKINFESTLKSFNFIGGVTNDTPHAADPPRPGGANWSDPTQNPYNWGTQFPWYTVGGVKLHGGGTAVVLLSDHDCLANTVSGVQRYFDSLTNTTDPNTATYPLSTYDYIINYDPWGVGGVDSADLTLQCPGYTNTTSQTVVFEVYKANVACSDASYPGGSGGAWVSLLADTNGNPLFDFSKAMITKADLKINPEFITVDFEFSAYIVSSEYNCF